MSGWRDSCPSARTCSFSAQRQEMFLPRAGLAIAPPPRTLQLLSTPGQAIRGPVFCKTKGAGLLVCPATMVSPTALYATASKRVSRCPCTCPHLLPSNVYLKRLEADRPSFGHWCENALRRRETVHGAGLTPSVSLSACTRSEPGQCFERLFTAPRFGTPKSVGPES